MLRTSSPPRKKARHDELQNDVHGSHQRPEELHKPGEFFSGNTSTEYHRQNEQVQLELTDAAIRLFFLFNGSENIGSILDIGCGSGFSSSVMADTFPGCLLAFDISGSMLKIANDFLSTKASCNILLYQGDCAQLFPLRSNSLEGILSISVIQWLSEDSQIESFFKECYRCLQMNSTAVFQFYPNSPEHADQFVTVANTTGFHSYLIMDMPHKTPQKKLFLLLSKTESPTRDKYAYCPLSYPFNATCTLCVKQQKDIEAVPQHMKLNKAKDIPQEHWLLRYHITKALEIIKKVQRKKHKPTVEYYTKELSQELQNQFDLSTNFDLLQQQANKLLSVYHKSRLSTNEPRISPQ